ncbi:Chloroperoxidase [Mycena albidolilacea]|uniref:Chloroperoxidase n=1 Tax=Mycena albidolilacea TaxID=1033008 RepID=A0AAD7E9F6_9AGAR|nr:Chloroperoxidase [Mycena albidolilacea]
MKFFSLLLLVPSSLFTAVNAWHDIRDTPSNPIDIQDGQTGVLMVLPPAQTDTSIKRVPDAGHPFIAPGPNDMRGRKLHLFENCVPVPSVSSTACPGMNTLANHGYISRNGITTFEEIINAVGEAFNINRNQGAGMAAMNILTRGNPFVNKISIGGVSPFIPPLPGQIDGPATQGIAKHGRVEGDASITHADVHIGDNRNFNKTLWETDLEILANFGDDGPDGPATVFNLQTLIEMKRQKLESDQLLDADARSTIKFSIPIRRLNLVFAAPSFFISTFANGTTGLATKYILTSFLMDQKFPDNWFRNGFPMQGSSIPAQIAAALPQWVPGRNDENGVFVADPPAPAPFNISGGCANYWDVLTNAVPGPLANVTGIFKQNVVQGILFNGSGCTEPLAPAGPTDT